MKRLAFSFFLALVFISPARAEQQPLSERQYKALMYVVVQISVCPAYSLNFGRNKPFEDGCVNRLVESASELLRAFLPEQPHLARNVENIKRCPAYSLNYGTNKPYEEGCVIRLIENTIADIRYAGKLK